MDKRGSILLIALACGSVAQAQDEVHHAPVPGGDGAVDQPFEHHAAPPSPSEDEPEPPPAARQASMQALTAFRRQHLAIRSYARWEGGGATVIHGGWGGWGPYHHLGWGLGTSYVIRDPAHQTHDWAVFRGDQRLSVPAYLEEVGDTARLGGLQRDIERAELSHHVGYGVGLAGAATLLVAMVGVRSAQDLEGYQTWNSVALGGVLAGVGGVMVGSHGNSKAQRLRADFRSTVDYDAVQEQVDAYNERLRGELGLSPAEAFRELSDEERPGRARRR
jgi:hypothetical protein